MKRYINKNNILEIIISITVLIGIILICMEYESPVYSTINKTKELKRKDFAMYKGTPGNYQLVDDDLFPSVGYRLNTDKTYCKDINENKIKNIVNMVNGKAQVTSDKTVYCYLYFDVSTFVFDYTGSEQEFIVPVSGTYKLETWGAQGGSYNDTYYGGYGGYSVGEIVLNKNDKIYINTGGSALLNSAQNVAIIGGYNGGGTGKFFTYTDSQYGTRNFIGYAGGGVSHIALDSGLLSTLSSHATDNRILIVAGGGGGAGYNPDAFPIHMSVGGSGGGYIGVNGGSRAGDSIKVYGIGGTQSSAGYISNNQTLGLGQFGNGGNGSSSSSAGSGGGGGYYGGGAGFGHSGSFPFAAGGGSGYIGNTNLTNKHMTCYNCATSNEVNTKTISNTCVDANPVSDCSKQGNGYAKITFIG